MSFFSRNRNDTRIQNQKLHSGVMTDEMMSPSRQMRNQESAMTHDFAADQYRRRVRENDAYMNIPGGSSRFGNLDHMANRQQDLLYEEAHRQQAQNERAKAYYQQMLMEPYTAEVQANNRARALGYSNEAARREAEAGRKSKLDLVSALFSGLTNAFAPFAQSSSSNINQLLGGLMDTDITMRDNNFNPIGGVMATIRRPATNTYGAA